MADDVIVAWHRDGAAFASSDVLVPWWSVTKTVLAVACLRLAEQGRLDPGRRLDGRGFSVRDLLRHEAGVPSYTEWPEYHGATEAGEPAWADAEVLARADEIGPKFAVGEDWDYSNTGYLIVRLLIEEVTGMPIAAALAALVFDPLALRSVRIARSPEELAACRWLAGAGYDPKWVYHGLAVGSPADAARFMYAVACGDFLTRQSYEHLVDAIDLSGPIEERPWERAAYGLGVMNGDLKDVGTVVGHSGNGPGSVAAVYAADGVAVAAFAGDGQEYGVEWQVQRMMLDLRKAL